MTPTIRSRVLRSIPAALLAGLLAIPGSADAQRLHSPADLSGDWDLILADPDGGDRAGRLRLADRQGNLVGRLDWEDGSAVRVTGRREGDRLSLEIPSFTGVPLEIAGSVAASGTEMSGEYGTAGAWMAYLDLATTAAGPPVASPGPTDPSPDRDRPSAGPVGAIPSASGPPTGVSGADVRPTDPPPTDGLPPTAELPTDPIPGARRGPDGRIRPRITAGDFEGGVDQAVSNLADDLSAGASVETATRGLASDAVEVTAQEAGRQAADAVSDLASDALARGVGGATREAVGAGLREALDLQGASDATPLEAAGQALADAAVGIAAAEARQQVSEAASDVVKDEIADKVGEAAGGVLGQTLGNAVDAGGLLGGLFGRGDDDPEKGDVPAAGTLSGRWRFVLLESRGDGVVTHAAVLDLSEEGDDVKATLRWSGSAPAFLPGPSLSGDRDGLRISVRPDDSGPILRGVVDGEARRMGGYVSSGGFLGLWQATR